MVLRNISVLAIEDDKFIVSAYMTKFHKSGINARFAGTVLEAKRVLKSFQPDVIILDILLPKNDGFGILEFLKKDKRFSDTQIIVATNLEEEEYVKKARDLGVHEYVVKSGLVLKDLVNRVKEISNEL